MEVRRTCCVEGCTQATREWMKNTNPIITFHCLPRAKEVREKWISALSKANGMNWVVKRDSRVCSLHFGEYCWESKRTDGEKKLRWSAVPLHFNSHHDNIPLTSKEAYSYDHPYCSGVFKKRKGLSDVTNKQCSEHNSGEEPTVSSHSDKNQTKDTSNNSFAASMASSGQFNSNPGCLNSSVKENVIFDHPYANGKKKKGKDHQGKVNRENCENIYSKKEACIKSADSSSSPIKNTTMLSHSSPNNLSVQDHFRHQTYLKGKLTHPAVYEEIPQNSPIPDAEGESNFEDPLVFASDTSGLELLANVAAQTSHENSTYISEADEIFSGGDFFESTALDSEILAVEKESDLIYESQVLSTSKESFVELQNDPKVEQSFIPTAPDSLVTATNSDISLDGELEDLRSCNASLQASVRSQSDRERALEAELRSSLKRNEHLEEQLASLSRLANKLHRQNVNLVSSNRVVTRRNAALQNRCTNIEKSLCNVFNKDQIAALGRKSSQGMKWEPATIKDGLILKMKCGTTGYEEVRKKMPFPSARTLQRHVQHIAFESGIIDDVFDMILGKIKNCKAEELDCMLAADEMAIDPCEMIDPSTKKPIGRVNLKSHDGVATKALVFILGGITSRWKQTVAYYFTRAKAEGEDSDAVGRELASIINEIIKRAENIGLRVHSLTTDMGPENRAVWRVLGVVSTRTECIYAAPHPVRKGEWLCIVPDVPHLFKSFKRMLVANRSIFLPDDIVAEENLPSSEVKACHINDLLDFQDAMELKIAPKLKKESLTPKGHFQGMKVGNSRSVINRRTATGLQVLALKKQDPSYITTAWFINHVNRWFELMTSRSRKLALSKARLDKYTEATAHLNKTVRIFSGIRVGKCGTWKPVQTGVILATKSILHLQDYFLNARGFQFVLTARFSQDFLENLFSSVRARQCTPNALAFKNILKVVTIAQYCRDSTNTSYDQDDGEYLLDFLAYTKEEAGKRKADASQSELLSVEKPQATDVDINRLPYEDRLVIYDFAAAVLASVRKTSTVCDNCFRACLHDRPEEPHPYSLIAQLNSVCEGALVMATDCCYKAIAKAELVFRSCKEELMAADINVQEVLVKSWSEYLWRDSDIPECHSITTKILWRFVRMRWRIQGQRSSAAARDAAKVAYGSKSMAMHTVVH